MLISAHLADGSCSDDFYELAVQDIELAIKACRHKIDCHLWGVDSNVQPSISHNRQCCGSLAAIKSPLGNRLLTWYKLSEGHNLVMQNTFMESTPISPWPHRPRAAE